MRCTRVGGKLKRVHYGDPNLRIKKSNPAKRKSFRAWVAYMKRQRWIFIMLLTKVEMI